MDRGKEQGKRDEVAYVEVFILLHQEKESQRATIFRHGDLRENPVGYLDKRHERHSGDKNQLRTHQSF